MPDSIPDLSVVLPAPSGGGGIAKILQHLRAQTAAHRMEMLVLVPAGTACETIADQLSAFPAGRIVAHPPGVLLSEIRAIGVRAARGRIVTFAEDHCFPTPAWAEALIRAHDAPVAAVGPQLENANPATAMSRADFLLNFGGYAAPVRGGASPSLAWHNTSYKRALLDEFGDRLSTLFEAEGLLQDELRGRGHVLWMEPEARAAHANFSRVRWFTWGHFVGGRLYGARRVAREQWSLARRAVYVAGGLLTPAMRVGRIWGDIRRTGQLRQLARLLPALTLGLAAHAIGEMVGCAIGVGRAAEHKSALEFNRFLYVVPQDRAAAGG